MKVIIGKNRRVRGQEFLIKGKTRVGCDDYRGRELKSSTGILEMDVQVNAEATAPSFKWNMR